MMQVTTVPILPTERPLGTGGFLDPDRIADQFGTRPGMSVADFGAGGGFFALLLAAKVGPTGKVYAMDILEEKLDNLRAKARARGLDNIETIRTNLEVLGSSSLADNSQDLSLLANILFQSSKRKEIIKEGYRILKQGGEFVLIDWKKGTGGFGPPDSLRLDKDEIVSVCGKEGLILVGELDAGRFHFGVTFKKK